MPAIASFAVFQFLWVWNDLLIALVYHLGDTPNMAPVTMPLAVFFKLQHYFVRGILAGSVKL